MSEQCKEDARTHGVLPNVERLAKKLEQDQSPAGLERFPLPYLKKPMARRGRLIIEEHKFGEDLLLCFARYFIRGSAEYEMFSSDAEAYYRSNQLPTKDLLEYLEERRREPQISKPQLSEAEAAYLQHVSGYSAHSSGAIMESYEWFERIANPDEFNDLSRYYDLIVDIIDRRFAEGEDTVSHPNNRNIKVLFRKFPEYNLTYLIAPLHANEPDDERLVREKYKWVLSDAVVEKEEIVKESRRAYPETIAFDEEPWKQIQQSVEANLALSPEEEEILKMMLTPGKSRQRYPLFINGRPGSGKSTILQYLFAEHLQMYLHMGSEVEQLRPPLYLTYSAPLLEQARGAVKNIVTCNFRTLESGEQLTDTSALELALARSFRQFQTFLKDQLPESARSRFVSDRYVDFGRFRMMWERVRRGLPDSDARRVGPELAWHVIRTYIKGMNYDPHGTNDVSFDNHKDVIVDPQYYREEMPRSGKTVSNDVFELVFNHAWDWYAKLCREQQLWDDQALVLEVLRLKEGDLAHYPAVFCDEAQDFTSLELHLIQKLSLYSDRELPAYLVRDVPFAFAGDPFQTLNPTSFNWNHVKAAFHENIVQGLGGAGGARLDFNFQELHFNYRSAKNIVKLANVIQLVRGLLLGEKSVYPQQTWSEKSTASPVWFRRDDVKVLDAIREQQELVIIVPCQENGELDYIRKDSFLSSIALTDDDEKVTRNILSPARAKGLEYDRVLLYGFGDAALERGSHLVHRIKNPKSGGQMINNASKLSIS